MLNSPQMMMMMTTTTRSNKSEYRSFLLLPPQMLLFLFCVCFCLTKAYIYLYLYGLPKYLGDEEEDAGQSHVVLLLIHRLQPILQNTPLLGIGFTTLTFLISTREYQNCAFITKWKLSLPILMHKAPPTIHIEEPSFTIHPQYSLSNHLLPYTQDVVVSSFVVKMYTVVKRLQFGYMTRFQLT